jgi:hypothetical protein
MLGMMLEGGMPGFGGFGEVDEFDEEWEEDDDESIPDFIDDDIA